MGRPDRNLAWLAKHHFGWIRVASFALCSMPALWLALETLSGSLGMNPLERLLRFTGHWALILLLVTLAITPARRLSIRLSRHLAARWGRRLSDWNWLIRLRRQLGLFSFFYASLHLSLYLALDAGFDALSIVSDFIERPFMMVGLVAFVLLVPLAATSNQAAIRRLGRNWQRLHRLSYVIAVVAVTHYWLQMKADDTRPLADSAVLVALLAARALAWRRGERGAAIEAPERSAAVRTGLSETVGGAPSGGTPGSAGRQGPLKPRRPLAGAAEISRSDSAACLATRPARAPHG